MQLPTTKQRRLGMKKLAELVKVEENNENCVLLKVKPKSSIELMKIGFFNGNEQYFRVTKSKRFAMHTLTVWRKNENAWSISWGTDIAHCAEILKNHNCEQAINVDGGASGMMWYNGEYLTRCANGVSSDGRPVPNACVYRAAGYDSDTPSSDTQ